MSKRKTNRPSPPNPVIGWLIGGGVLLAVIAVILFIFTGQKPQVQPISQLTTEDFHSLAFSPSEAETIYFGHHGGLLVSRNGGKDWQPSTLTGVDAMALALPTSNPQVMYAAGHEVFYKSSDAGQTWQAVKTNLLSLDIHGFAADSNDANHLYAYIAGANIYGSTDGGSTWTERSAPSTSTYNLAVGENGQILYAATTQQGLWRSTDSGSNWTKLGNLPGAGAIAVAYAATSKQLYASTIGDGAGMYISTNGGETWASAFTGNILAIAVSPLNNNHLVILNEKGQVYASRDNGKSWTGK